MRAGCGFGGETIGQAPENSATGSGVRYASDDVPSSVGNVILARADGTALSPLTLNAGTIFVRPANLLPNGQAQSFLPAIEGERYAVQASADLVNWSNLLTNAAASEFMNLRDAEGAAYPYRFYCWRQEP